jgi:hypothetical protein
VLSRSLAIMPSRPCSAAALKISLPSPSTSSDSLMASPPRSFVSRLYRSPRTASHAWPWSCFSFSSHRWHATGKRPGVRRGKSLDIGRSRRMAVRREQINNAASIFWFRWISKAVHRKAPPRQLAEETAKGVRHGLHILTYSQHRRVTIVPVGL